MYRGDAENTVRVSATENQRCTQFTTKTDDTQDRQTNDQRCTTFARGVPLEWLFGFPLVCFAGTYAVRALRDRMKREHCSPLTRSTGRGMVRSGSAQLRLYLLLAHPESSDSGLSDTARARSMFFCSCAGGHRESRGLT